MSGFATIMNVGAQFDVPFATVNMKDGLKWALEDSTGGLAFGLGTGARVQIYGKR